MLLYHFTAAHFVPSIRAKGLTRGRLPWNLNAQGRPEMLAGFQWLTTNADYLQPWCLLGDLPYSRNAVRITVHIPATHWAKVFPWVEMCRRCRPHCADEVNAVGGDIENWRVFRGSIPPAWFVAIEPNMNERLRPEHIMGA